MESIRLPFKNDAYGNPIYCRVSWANTTAANPRPIVLVYHTGGLGVGSHDIIPKPQIEYLTSQGFVVAAPNYRLSPQVTAKISFEDAEDAYNWASTALEALLADKCIVDPARIVTMGHSIGGTMALHVAAAMQVRAVTAFYPPLYSSDPDSPARFPTSAPPFGLFPDYEPSPQEWATITPPDHQVSEFPLALPGTQPQPRHRWQAHNIKHGTYLSIQCPDGDMTVLDPMTRLNGADWPPTMLVQGDADVIPGCGATQALRAEQELRAAGVEVKLEMVQGEGHMFDHPPMVGTTDLGPKWEAVVKGMEWLRSRV